MAMALWNEPPSPSDSNTDTPSDPGRSTSSPGSPEASSRGALEAWPPASPAFRLAEPVPCPVNWDAIRRQRRRASLGASRSLAS